jgi:hypothetical protein
MYYTCYLELQKKVLMLWYKISAMYGMAAALISIRLFSFSIFGTNSVRKLDA